VLVHGSHITAAFAPLLEEPALADRFQLIRYHRRGFAGSTHPDAPVSIVQQASDCCVLMLHLGVQCAHGVGNSYERRCRPPTFFSRICLESGSRFCNSQNGAAAMSA
jgi:pimeloyl-ACP methyl ester carboxylesterase